MSLEQVVEQLRTDRRITDISQSGAEFQFVPKGFSTTVRIRISQSAETGRMPYCFETSHHTHTPLQSRPLVVDPWERTADAAASRAVEGILSYIQEAEEMGFSADDGWLIENGYWLYQDD